MFRKSAGIFSMNTSNHHGAAATVTFSPLILLVCAALLFLTTPIIAEITWTGDLDPSDPTTWTSNTEAYIGKTSSGTMGITNGSTVSSGRGYIGNDTGITGEVTVDGMDSLWTVSETLFVGGYGGFRGWGSAMLNITGGGTLRCVDSSIATTEAETAKVIVSGASSTWINTNNLSLSAGFYSGSLDITDAGLVGIGGTLDINTYGYGDSFINMATGGMLALNGEGNYSLGDFLNLLDPYSASDAIRYWDYPSGDWADIAGATLGEDYTLEYITEGDLTGYTMLTVLEQALLEGDANYNGVVSAGDYGVVQANFGSTGIPGIHGDANGDGVVSASDYACVQANFGSVAAGANPIPEPGILSLLVIGGLGMLRRKQK